MKIMMLKNIVHLLNIKIQNQKIQKNQKNRYQLHHHQITNNYSHSIVAGGLELISYTTRLIPETLFIIVFDTSTRNLYENHTNLLSYH